MRRRFRLVLTAAAVLAAALPGAALPLEDEVVVQAVAGSGKPTTARAGSVVTASVRVTSNGSPARPRGVRCTGRIGSANVRGVPRASAGRASCTYRTPVSARGRTLRGAISLSLNGQRFVRRFSTRLT